MKLKSLEIVGFKSFVDRTVVRFDHAITGVVGPNGCGKSNIVDAIRWAMGEQSAKHLRGKHMDDVIFNGSEVRGPHSFAEVTLTFDNEEGLAPAEFSQYAEIAVTRRLTRDGESGYMINKTPVRLMDVTSLFLGTGVGTKAYSIIEQGRIGLIVTAKPEERRHLIEEAAGITRFKARKKKAERKMEQTRQNLQRVGDIVGELEKSLASLKRQAQKAERYKVYRDEQRDLELWVGAQRYLELFGSRRVLSGQLEETRVQSGDLRTELSGIETRLESERHALSEVEHTVEAATRRSHELDNEVRLLEAQLRHHEERIQQLRAAEQASERELSEMQVQEARMREERDGLARGLAELEDAEQAEAEVLAGENDRLSERRAAADDADKVLTATRARGAESRTRIARAEAVLAGFERRRQDARARHDRLSQERERAEGRCADLKDQARELAARLNGLRGNKESSVERKAELSAQLEALRSEQTGVEQRLEQVRGELSERRSRLRSLEQILERLDGVGVGVRELIKLGGADAERGIRGLFADRVDCPPEWTQALAGALGDRLQCVIVEDFAAGARAVEDLRSRGKGRATVVPRTPKARPRAGEALLQRAGVLGCLADLVRFEPADEALVRNFLSGAFVVEDLEVARALHEADAIEGVLVTRAGEVVGADGRITGGSGEDAGAAMLGVKYEVRELTPLVAQLEQDFATITARHREVRASIAERQAELDAARSEGHDAEIAIVKTEKDLRRAEEELASNQKLLEQRAAELTELESALAEAGDEESEARSEIEAAESARQEAESERESAEQVCNERREAVEAQSTIVTEVRVRAAEARQRAESDRAGMERLDRSLAELTQRDERARAEQVENARKQEETAAAQVSDSERLAEAVSEAQVAEQALGEARAKYEEAKLLLGEKEQGIRGLRGRIDALSDEANALSLKEQEASLAIGRLIEQLEERHRVDVRHCLNDFHSRELPEASVYDRIKELQRLLDRMGAINLTAIEEYEEQSQRYEYLTSQRADLESALEQLEKAIRQMNRESRKLFRETFDSVAKRFERIFPQMFGGGRGELRLTNPEDMLETGVEIIAQPPGKRIGSMELMSGGEKALTAVALIFALFQHKPSPFCLLDEVDAPLDEANIGRFAEAVRMMTSQTQFIVITHSKRTMEIADVLYGVTMEQPGVSTLVSVELRKGSSQSVSTNGAQVA